MTDLAKINREQRLYVIKAGSGFTCWGFDVADRRARAYAEWMGNDVCAEWPKVGTQEHFEACRALERLAEHYAQTTGKRCPVNLAPELAGLEGKRVEVATPDGYRKRFWVGKSTGWCPCHLEVANRRSAGGPAAYIPKGATVRVVRGDTI